MGAAAGLALLLGGEILVRRDLRGVAAAVAGSGIAILTLTNWAAFALYALSGFPVAFALGCAITVIGYAWSVWRSLVLTLLLAEIGGFLTPVLIQKESTGPWSLALYLALVAGAAGFGAARRAWRSPTVLGIFGILVIYTAWIAANSSRVYESWTVSTGWAVAFLTAVPALDVAWRAIRGIRLGKQEAPALFACSFGGGVVTVYLEERFRTDLGTILGVYAAMLFAICTFARPEARGALRLVGIRDRRGHGGARLLLRAGAARGRVGRVGRGADRAGGADARDHPAPRRDVCPRARGGMDRLARAGPREHQLSLDRAGDGLRRRGASRSISPSGCSGGWRGRAPGSAAPR